VSAFVVDQQCPLHLRDASLDACACSVCLWVVVCGVVEPAWELVVVCVCFKIDIDLCCCCCVLQRLVRVRMAA
jgi:hypothetical protein